MDILPDHLKTNPVLSAAANGDLEALESSWIQNAVQPFARSQWSRASPRENEKPTITDIATVAAAKSQPSVLAWCFDKGFSQPASSITNEFFLAVLDSHSVPVCQVLLDHGFDFNQHHFDVGGNVLISSITDGDLETARWLLEHGHSPNTDGPGYGSSHIVEAVAGDNASIEAVKLLLDYGLDLRRWGEGAVLKAADVGNVEALALLLDHGGNVEEQDGYHEFDEDKETIGTPLYRACSKEQTGAVRLLLERGANPRFRTEAGESCIEAAKRGGYMEIVELLEEKCVAK